MASFQTECAIEFERVAQNWHCRQSRSSLRWHFAHLIAMFIKKYGIYLSILIVCLAIGLKTAMDTPLGRHTLEIRLNSSQTGVTELFYDDGLGFSAEKRIPGELLESGVDTDLVFELPQPSMVRLRWDPVYHEEGVQTTVNRIQVSFYGGEYVRDVVFETLVPQNHIKTFRIDPSRLYFEVDPGFNDPYLILTKIPEAPEPPSRTWLIVKGFAFSLLAALLLSAIYRLIVWYFNS